MKPVCRRIASCRIRATLTGLALFVLCLTAPAQAAGLAGNVSFMGAHFAAIPWFVQSALPAGAGMGFLPICLIMFLSAICLRQFIH